MAVHSGESESNGHQGEKRTSAGILIAIIAISLAMFHLCTAYFGALQALQQRTVHLSLVLVLVFLMYPSKKGHRLWRILDYFLAAVSLSVGIYMYINADQFALHAVDLAAKDVLVGIAGTLLVLEGTRRVMGFIMPLIATVFLLYTFLGPYMPAIVAHRGFSPERVAYQMFFTMEGILGSPLGISATFVAVFIIFAAFLKNSGAGDFFIGIAYSVFGRFRGGPAKVAIIGSSLFGMVSGSAVANVAGVGTFTIPMMKSAGYSPTFAAAVEAVSSTGGQIMPPVMGAAAFIMTEFLGVSYASIALAAVVPALLYYLAVYIMVDLEAAKNGIAGVPRDKLPALSLHMRKGWLFIMPLAVLIYLLVVDSSTPSRAGFWAIVATIIVGVVHSGKKLSFKDLVKSLEEGGKGVIEVAAACATAGIIVGSITLTGIGLKLSMLLLSIAGGSTIVLLILTAILSLILGMGMPTTAAYLLVATLIAPALIKMGIYPLAAHLFVFYFSVISMITPPVALAAYAAAGLAKADPTKTGFSAMRLGISSLIVPFMFVYGPELLLKGAWIDVVISIIAATIGIFALSVAIIGWLSKQLLFFTRVIMFFSALLLIKPGLITDLIGLVLLAIGFILIKTGIGARHAGNESQSIKQ